MKLQSLIDENKRAEVKRALAEGRLDRLLDKKKPKPEPAQVQPAKQLITEEQERLNSELINGGSFGFTERIRQLVEKGADVNARDGSGWTALGYAVAKGHTETAEILIAQGADVNARNKGGITALMIAAFNGRTEIAEMLIAKGADVNARNDSGYTAIRFAYQKLSIGIDKTETVEMLKRHGAKE